MGTLEETLARIGRLDEAAAASALERQNDLTKPRGALGILEDISVRIAGITGNPRPQPGRKMVLVLAADHGVTQEGISLYPSEVTPQMVHNFLAGGAAINVLARHAGAEVRVVDMGMASPFDHPDLISRRVKPGTDNMAVGPAMSRAEAVAAVEAGIEIAAAQIESGVEYLAVGEMGIGNTTAASAIAACLAGLDPAVVTGRGTGLDDATLEHKVEIVRRALEINRPDPSDAMDVLQKVGGLEIAGIAGAILAAAASRRPVLVDGFISAAGAYIAAGLHPRVVDFMIASHRSVELGHGVILDRLGLRPLIFAEMRLGEGTGAALAFTLVDASLKILAEMATFDEAGVSGPEA
jgi:nicotinate-nucleotide--dimethylbenzimidazole phosphoribosyltransferase